MIFRDRKRQRAAAYKRLPPVLDCDPGVMAPDVSICLLLGRVGIEQAAGIPIGSGSI